MDKRIGAQLYTCRNFCQTIEDFDSTLKKVSDIGYKTVQVSGVGAELTGADMKAAADKYGIEIICTHRGLDEFVNGFDGLVKLHKDMNCSVAGLGAMPGEPRESKEKLFEFINQFDEISKKLGEEGITFGYHNHAFEFAKMDGKFILDHIVENTNPNFKLILDLYWVAHAGLDVVDTMEKYADRITVLHYKDKRVVGNDGQYAEIGEGNLNWDKIIAATEKLNIAGTMVEQDNYWMDDDPFKSLDISYKFLAKKGFI